MNWESSVDYVNANNIGELEGCTSVDGHIRILNVTLYG